MILSASRRTDIPSFYSEWFMNRVREGYVLTKNPMNPTQVSKVTLTPKKIDCIVFWTKDPANMMDKLSELDAMGYHYYFQFTLNPYGNDIEHNLRDKKEIRITFQHLSEKIGKERIIWRYDPIILNEMLTIDYHRNSFLNLCQQLQGNTDTCIISFVDLYQKLNKTVKEEVIRNIPEEQMHELATVFAGIGAEYGIEIRACCEKIDLQEDGVKPASCIDKALMERICGHSIIVKKDKNQRLGCGCIQSIDIGIYNTCLNGCIYCYANHSAASIHKNCTKHNPSSDILIGTVGSDVKIIDRM